MTTQANTTSIPYLDVNDGRLIPQHFQVFDFELSDDDMRAIAQLDSGDGRIGPDPSTFG